MIRSNLCDYSDSYIRVSPFITINGEGDDAATKKVDEGNKGVIFKNCNNRYKTLCSCYNFINWR